MIRTGILGAAGYTGGELIRLLLNHPEAEIVFAHSESSAGKLVSDVHEGLIGETELRFSSELPFSEVDVLFLCFGHGKSEAFIKEHAPQLLPPSSPKIIDLAQDFRLQPSLLPTAAPSQAASVPCSAAPSPSSCLQPTAAPSQAASLPCSAAPSPSSCLQPTAAPSQAASLPCSAAPSPSCHDFVYGLPETNRELISQARHIANPGCFATAIQLGLLPLAKAGLLTHDIAVNAITGSTGAGQKPSSTTHFSWRAGNLSTYKLLTHQHLHEICQTLNALRPASSPRIINPLNEGFPLPSSAILPPSVAPSQAASLPCSAAPSPSSCVLPSAAPSQAASLPCSAAPSPSSCLPCPAAPSQGITLDFIPYRGDFPRGIFCTELITLDQPMTAEEIAALYRAYYNDTAFTHYSAKPLDLKQVINTNKALVHADVFGRKVVVTSIIDNLLKGAVGQAVQNMNLMFGLDEKTGLRLKASAF